MIELINEFTADKGVQLAAALVALDIVLGVSAAVYLKKFQLSYAVDFLRNDILAKLVPYFAVWMAVRVGGDWEVAGLGAIESVTNAAIVAALGASILNSLRDLNVWSSAPDSVAGPDPRAGV